MDKRFYTIQEFRRISGIGITRIYELLAGGHIVACKAGRRTLITAESAERYFASLPRAFFATAANRKGHCEVSR